MCSLSLVKLCCVARIPVVTAEVHCSSYNEDTCLESLPCGLNNYVIAFSDSQNFIIYSGCVRHKLGCSSRLQNCFL